MAELFVPNASAAGEATVELGDRSIDCARPGALAFDMRELKREQRSTRSEIYAVTIEQRILTNRLFEITGEPVRRKLRFTPEWPANNAAVDALRAFLLGLDRAMLAPALQTAPHSAQRLSALLTDLMLEFLPHNYREALHRTPRLVAPKHVKRAVEFIQANANRAFATEDLVAVAGVSLRALQYGFQKFLEVSISEYERSVRLDGARRDIERNPGERVAVIAKRWSFSNFTRFNTQFEGAFGISAVAFQADRNQNPTVQNEEG